MDSGSESLVFESVDENEVSPERGPLVDHNPEISSDSLSHVNDKLGSEESVGGDAILAGGVVLGDATSAADSPAQRELKAVEPMSTPPSATSSAADDSLTRKGYGLKKWRRIRREFAKDVSPSTDSNKILKRVLPAQANPDKPSTSKPPHISAGSVQNTETSVGSVNGLRYDGVGDEPVDRGSPISSTFAVAPTFAAGVDSDNSEDRSSKSSTAASAPRFRTEQLPAGLAYAAEKNRIKSFSGKSFSNSMQSAQQGKSRTESSKKARGDRIKIEKENSHSSVESDSRSSNFVFMQAPFSATSNGKKSGTSRDYEGECSDEVQESEQHFSEGGQTGYSKGNAEDSEGHSQDDSAADIPWKAKERRENHHSSKDHDPLLDSIASLNSVQESLEKELQKLAEIGKEPFSPHFNSVNGDSPAFEQGSQTSPDSLETQVLTLTENLEHLEAMLEEARHALRVKESRVSELEATLINNTSRIPKEELGSEVDAELESLFQQRIEAEVEFLAITSTMQSLKIQEQETLHKFSLAETKAVKLQEQVEEMDSLSGGDIVGVDEVLKLQKGTCKVSVYLFMQLALFGIVLYLFVLRFSYEPTFSEPTFSVPT